MNRLQLAAALLFAVPLTALPQVSGGEQAIEWTSSVAAVPGLAGHTYELRLEGRIASGYIVYGPDFEVDIGPRPVRLKLNEGLTARGPLRAAETRRRHDPVFKGEYSYLQGVARLSQQLDVKPGTARVAGTLRGQTCREADGTCSLFSYRFEVALP